MKKIGLLAFMIGTLLSACAHQTSTSADPRKPAGIGDVGSVEQPQSPDEIAQQIQKQFDTNDYSACEDGLKAIQGALTGSPNYWGPYYALIRDNCEDFFTKKRYLGNNAMKEYRKLKNSCSYDYSSEPTRALQSGASSRIYECQINVIQLFYKNGSNMHL